jgi:hypothetical protein
LIADVARYARQAATEAVSGLSAARTRAESAGAPASAAAAFGRAVERERSARALLAARDYAKAATAAYAAQGLFDAAAAESLGRTQARAAAEPPVTRTSPPPPAEEPRAPIQFPAVAAVPPPAPAPAPAPGPPAAPPAVSTPPRAPAASERRSVDPQEAIRRALQQYSAALEARSLPALKQIWPGLGGAQERAIKTEFNNARRISVTLDSPSIDVSGDTATVVATRHYSLATVDGHELRSDARSTFQLRAAEGGWVIESVRFEAAR